MITESPISAPLLAAGIFGSIGMLAWATAALLPLLLHMWNRNQHRETSWAAMEFLLAAVQERSRRMRIEQLLLLLLRMSIPVVLALALADPIWQMLPALGSSLGSRAPQHHLFVVDLSYSMGYETEGDSRLSKAKALATKVIDEMPQGDGFTIISMSDPSEVVVGVPAFAPEDAKAVLSELRLRDSIADLPTALDLVGQTLEKVKSGFPRLEKHNVYFLSDMGETTWNAATQPDVRSRIGQLESAANIVTVDTGQENAKNIAITSVRRRPPVITPDTNVTWQVTAEKLAGAQAGTGQHNIELLVDGRLTDKQAVSFAEGATTSTTFQYRFDSVGDHTVAFRLEPATPTSDGLPVDNQHHQVLTVRDSYNLLCVEGKIGAARNVALAIAPSEESSYEVRTIPDHRLSDIETGEYDVVFLCNVGRFTAQRATQLRSYLNKGRSVVMFLGDQASAENYNQQLGGGNGQPAILPTILNDVSSYGTHRFAPGDYRHPLIQAFRGQERAGLLTTPVWQYQRLSVPESSAATVALEFANGDPAIVEQHIGGGFVAMVAVPASDKSTVRQNGQLKPWTAWSAWPSFPPMIQELLAQSIGRQSETRNIRVGESMSAAWPGTGSQFVTLRKPDGAERRLALQASADEPAWFTDDTWNSGIYSVRDVDSNSTQPFAVNLADTDEGELRRIAYDNLPDQFRENPVSTADATDSVSAATTPLFRLMLGLLLTLLLAESFVAWYLGNARA